MKKKVLFLLLVFCLFVTKVYAAGTFDNPDKNIQESVNNYFSISELNELELGEEVPIEDYKFYYYVYEVTIDTPKHMYWGAGVPALESGDEGVSVGVGIALPTDNLFEDDSSYAIKSDSIDLYDEDDWINANTALKAGTYYLVFAVLVPDTSTTDYTFALNYGTDDDVYKYELEPNNTKDLAFEAEINKMYYSGTNYDDDIDTFAFNLTAGKKARIYIGDISYRSDEDYPDAFKITVCAKSNTRCDLLDFNDFTYDNTRDQYYYEFTPAKSETYYVQVEDLLSVPFWYLLGMYQSGTIATVGLTDVDYYVENYTSSDEFTVYRLYNRFTGEHLYTNDANEVKVLYKDHQWGFEGIAWYTPTEGIPVYRLYNPILGNHLYTTDTNEVNVLTSQHGWVKDNDGKPVMYSTGDEEDVPIYRVYNKALNGMHHLTTDEDEYDALPQYGWEQEGVSMYASGYGYGSATEYYNVNF